MRRRALIARQPRSTAQASSSQDIHSKWLLLLLLLLLLLFLILPHGLRGRHLLRQGVRQRLPLRRPLPAVRVCAEGRDKRRDKRKPAQDGRGCVLAPPPKWVASQPHKLPPPTLPSPFPAKKKCGKCERQRSPHSSPSRMRDIAERKHSPRLLPPLPLPLHPPQPTEALLAPIAHDEVEPQRHAV